MPNNKTDKAAGGGNVVRQLSLSKGKERFVFRYRAGQEADVIDTLARMAEDGDSGLDWFDAAILSYQMGRRLETELDHMVKLQG
ncbi:MAG: hypothetical protein C4547_15080 [Phycisphaerales bacterium]|nr:MAG: hypothetical protein C4547_15080 [Phycisphaerales bacterium]